MAQVTGRDIILRMMGDVEDLKRGQERLVSLIIEHSTSSRMSLERMAAHLEELLEHQGQLEARMDAHEERLAALEKERKSS